MSYDTHEQHIFCNHEYVRLPDIAMNLQRCRFCNHVLYADYETRIIPGTDIVMVHLQNMKNGKSIWISQTHITNSNLRWISGKHDPCLRSDDIYPHTTTNYYWISQILQRFCVLSNIQFRLLRIDEFGYLIHMLMYATGQASAVAWDVDFTEGLPTDMQMDDAVNVYAYVTNT